MEDQILRALHENMGYRRGERVAIIVQEWAEHLGRAEDFAESKALAREMESAFASAGIPVRICSYIPSIPRNGVDATEELYAQFDAPEEVVFMPTVFSLTHTRFRKMLSERGSRIASMPGFTLALFAPNGPMDADLEALEEATAAVAQNLKSARSVHIRADGTEMDVEIEPMLVHSSTGNITKAGAVGNLPGAEAYAVPVHRGNSNGHFTVPAGWGGPFPLEHAMRFRIRNGAFHTVEAVDDTPDARRYAREVVAPLIFSGEDHEVFAELGIGTNPQITAGSIREYGWRILTAEKIWGSAHFANGNNAGMGGRNDVPVHIDWVVPNVSISYR